MQTTLGTLAVFFDDDLIGIACGVATAGNADHALTTRVGVFSTGDDVENEPAAMLGGELRVGRRVRLITENFSCPPRSASLSREGSASSATAS